MKVLILVVLSVILCAHKATPKSVFANEEDEGVIAFTPFIVNGVRSPHLPYFAHITFRNAAGAGFFGGGALISPTHVLTAATNIVGFNSWTIHLGSSNRTAMRAFITTTALSHPQYVATSRANDIGIITMQQAVVMSADINVIALPIAIANPPIIMPLEFEEGAVAGMGFSNAQSTGASQFLYRGFQRVTSVVRCSQFFNLAQLSGFCAEDTVERSNVCQGDVGGPFVLSDRRQDILAGIVTMPAPCGQHSPSAYTRITQFRPWIQQNTNV